MPLYELYRLAKRRLDSDQDFEAGNDVFELVWENGQVTTQGQSSRVRKEPTCNSLPSHCLPSYNPKSRDKDLGNGTSTTKTGKFGTDDSVLNEIPMSVPSDGGLGLDQDDDMMPWLNYPMDGSLQHEYYPDFLPELSGVTVNEISKISHNFASNDKNSSCNQLYRESNTNSVVDYCASLEQRNSSSKVASVVGSDSATRPRTGTSQLYSSSSSQQCQASFPSFRSRVLDTIGNNTTSAAHHAVCSDSVRVSSVGGFPSLKMHRQDSIPPSNSSNVLNFSHFSRPAVLAKANFRNISAMSGSNMPNKEKSSAANGNNLPKPGLIDTSRLRKETSANCQEAASSGVDLKLSEARPLEEPCAAKDSEALCQEDASRNDINNSLPCESTNCGQPEVEKNMEPVVASSSVCSGNSVERASDDPTHVFKRKFRDTDSECQSEDVEEESVGVKKTVPPQACSGSKRSRAAEVHNLSERRRRDRINEKMRALQELIPNCNKVDKASMLDEAIEYLKTLQLQVQIMSMGAGLCMPPMMLPSGMQPVHAPHMAHFSRMGVGMGMGMGFGMGFGMGMHDMYGVSSGYPMIQVSPMQGAHFPGPPMPGHTVAFHGMTGPNLPVFGLPGQGLSMPMQRAPLVPVMGGPFMKSATGLNASGPGGSMENLESTQPYTSKEPVQNMGSHVVQSAGPSSSMNQTTSQCQATNEGFEQSVLVQSNAQVSDANGNKASAPANGNDVRPSAAASYD